MELVRLAKARGIKVTCEVAPHHILLTDSDIPEDDPYFKMNPPLRSKEDQAALLVGIECWQFAPITVWQVCPA